MKRILPFLFALFALFSNGKVAAQSFSLTSSLTGDTVTENVAGIVDSFIYLKNLTGSNLTITWHVDSTDFPHDWLQPGPFGICDNALCRGNSNDMQLWNDTTHHATSFTSTYYANATHDSTGPFSLALDFTTVTTGGTHWVTISLSDGSTTKKVTFVVHKVFNAVATLPSATNNVELYPNPARSEVNLVYDASADVKNVVVYNIIGKVMAVYRVTNNTSANLNLETVPSGMYFAKLVNGRGEMVATRKFIKQ